MIEFDLSHCDSCSCCVYDDMSLSETQQEQRCPAFLSGSTTTRQEKYISNSYEWRKWRRCKLEEINEIISNGPVQLVELAPMIGVNMVTLRGWAIRYLSTYVAATGNSSRDRASYVEGVHFESRNISTIGRGSSKRHRQLQAIKSALANGPLPLPELAKAANMPYTTLWRWAKQKKLKPEKRRDGGDFRPNKKIYWGVRTDDNFI